MLMRHVALHNVLISQTMEGGKFLHKENHENVYIAMWYVSDFIFIYPW